MPLEILKNSKRIMDLDNYSRSSLDLLRIGDIINVNINNWKHYIPFTYRALYNDYITSKIVRISIDNGILLEFVDGMIHGHDGQLYDGSCNRWWM